MPLTPGSDVGETIRELHSGKTYARTRKKHGKQKAQKQAIAIALRNRRAGKKRHMRKSRKMARRS